MNWSWETRFSFSLLRLWISDSRDSFSFRNSEFLSRKFLSWAAWVSSKFFSIFVTMRSSVEICSSFSWSLSWHVWCFSLESLRSSFRFWIVFSASSCFFNRISISRVSDSFFDLKASTSTSGYFWLSLLDSMSSDGAGIVLTPGDLVAFS